MAQKKTASKAKKGSLEPLSSAAAKEPVSKALTDEEIAMKAYTLWEDRGKPFGSPDEDWHKAAELLRAEL